MKNTIFKFKRQPTKKELIVIAKNIWLLGLEIEQMDEESKEYFYEGMKRVLIGDQAYDAFCEDVVGENIYELDITVFYKTYKYLVSKGVF